MCPQIPPRANKMGPATRVGEAVLISCKQLTDIFHLFSLSPRLEEPSGDNGSVLGRAWGLHAANLREGLQIGDILLFSPFLLWKFAKKRDLFEWFAKSILRSILIEIWQLYGFCVVTQLPKATEVLTFNGSGESWTACLAPAASQTNLASMTCRISQCQRENLSYTWVEVDWCRSLEFHILVKFRRTWTPIVSHRRYSNDLLFLFSKRHVEQSHH